MILHTVNDDGWFVVIKMQNGQLVKVDNVQYASEATATLAAISMKKQKPFLDYVVSKWYD